jgi:hypothetical protein
MQNPASASHCDGPMSGVYEIPSQKERNRRNVGNKSSGLHFQRQNIGDDRLARCSRDEISTITAASSRRHPSPSGRATPSPCKCISRLAMPSTVTGATIGKLRQLRPATISRVTRPTKAIRKDRSAAMASQAGTRAEIRQATRPRRCARGAASQTLSSKLCRAALKQRLTSLEPRRCRRHPLRPYSSRASPAHRLHT